MTVSLLVIGAGQRGSGYARWVLGHPDRARVVGVAEPRAPQRSALASAHGIAAENTVQSWQELYRGMLDRGEHRWPLSVLVSSFTPAAVDDALRNGPYGRCVYSCDNDVVDHQVVSMEFPSSATAVFTMTAFNEAAQRSTRMFGTRGEMSGDGKALRVYDFLTRTEEVIVPDAGTDGHAGGDAGLMDAFVTALATGDRGSILSGPRESLASHLAVFAAERARLNGTVESLLSPGDFADLGPPLAHPAAGAGVRCGRRRSTVRPVPEYGAAGA